MNKKGFTLIELLAVIAILAILVVLAVPSVLKLFNQGKDTIFYSEARDIFNNVKKQYTAAHLTNPNAPNEMVFTDENKKLEMDTSNDLDYNITVTVDEESNVIVTKFSISKGAYSLNLINSSGINIDKIKEEDK